MALLEALFEGRLFLWMVLGTVWFPFSVDILYLVGGNGCVKYGVWRGLRRRGGMLPRDLKWETPAGTAVQLGRLFRTALSTLCIPTGSEVPRVGGNVSSWDSEWLGCRLNADLE